MCQWDKVTVAGPCSYTNMRKLYRSGAEPESPSQRRKILRKSRGRGPLRRNNSLLANQATGRVPSHSKGYHRVGRARSSHLVWACKFQFSSSFWSILRRQTSLGAAICARMSPLAWTQATPPSDVFLIRYLCVLVRNFATTPTSLSISLLH